MTVHCVESVKKIIHIDVQIEKMEMMQRKQRATRKQIDVYSTQENPQRAPPESAAAARSHNAAPPKALLNARRDLVKEPIEVAPRVFKIFTEGLDRASSPCDDDRVFPIGLAESRDGVPPE